jgi:hypothetical protein
VPHKVQNVFEYLEGNYPRLRLYLHSPAAQALAMAEKTFPVVRGSSEVDRAPLMKAVDLRYPFERGRPGRRVHVPLMGVSLLMLVMALALLWKSQR